MKNARRYSREFALQALYQWQLAGHDTRDLIKQFAEADGFARADKAFFTALVEGGIKQFDAVTAQLAPCLDRPWNEVSPIERGIMLLAGFELSAMPETPMRVVINEAIELAKAFGGTDGHKYVNGVLDQFAALARPEEVKANQPEGGKAPRQVTRKVAKVVAKKRRSFTE